MTSRTLGALLAAASVSVACNSDATKQKQPPVPVAVTRAAHRSVPYNLTADGVVEPMQTAQVQAQVSGILKRVSFKEGDNVRAGQVLFQIDPRPFQAALDQALANLARDHATWVDAKAEAERYLALVKKEYVTQELADQWVASERASAAAMQADSAAVEQARINLEWTTITAPISGRAGQLLVKQGNLARAGTQQPLVLINQIQPILVHFALPATNLPAIQQYAAKGSLAVTVTPGMPPGATAQTTLNGPTPAYTTETTADDAQGQSVGVGAPNDAGSAGGDVRQSGASPTNGSGTAGPGSGSPRRGGHGAKGAPAGTTPGSPGQADGGAAPAGGGSADGPPNTAATSAGGQNRGVTADSGASAAGSTRPRRPASMPGLPGVPAPAPAHGALSLIDNQVDTTTGTILLKATFPNADNMLWPGQFVATSVRLFTEENALVVPAQAVMMGQQGTYVYLVDGSGTAQQRQVTVERTSANTAVITSGLAEGDQVVTDGQSRLTPGAKVNIRGLVPPGAGGVTPGASSSSG